MRRVGTLATVALAILALAACGGQPPPDIDTVSDVDRQRAAILGREPVLAEAIGEPQVAPGRLRSERIGWERTEVRARLYEHAPAANGAGPRPAAVELELVKVLTTLRTGGWTVYWALCAPPPAVPEIGQPAPPVVRMPPDVSRDLAWQWVAFAYKIVNGVSYWAQVSAELEDGTAGAWVDVLFRAPHERDQANLFADTPKSLPAGKSCVDDRVVGKEPEQAGTLTYLRDWLPFPAQTRSPDPAKR